MEKNKKNPFFRFGAWVKDIIKWLFDFEDWKLLLRSIPGLVTALFIISVVVMNLMASKVIIQTSYLGITGGLFLSWLPFLMMDIIVKTYGSRAGTKMTILGLIINLCCIGVFQVTTMIQVGSETDYTAFDATFSQTWQIFVASSIAFIVSGIINNVLNAAIGKTFKKNPDGRLAYVSRTYISTMIGQFVDNFVFAGLAFLVFFQLSVGSSYGYTLPSVLGTALLGALVELLMEVVFSPIGYRICQKWKRDSVGVDYLEYIEKKKAGKDIIA